VVQGTKKLRKRFYFCVPKQFMNSWLETFNVISELKIINDLIDQEVIEPEATLILKPSKLKKDKTVKIANPDLFEYT